MKQQYFPGFAATVETEAVSGALPRFQNSPQRPAYGLYAEQLSGTAFTVPHAYNRRSWLYRLRPSADHDPFRPYAGARLLRSGPFQEEPPSFNRLRWDPLPPPAQPTDFVDGLVTWAGNGDVATGSGQGIHLYHVDRSMQARAFVDADGELLIVPQQGRLQLFTELGRIELAPLEIALIPRGVRFRVELLDDSARGYVCENYGLMFRLPELGPLGANALAASRHFLTPQAWFEDVEEPHEVIGKFQGRLWSTTLNRSPLDVVAWHGNLAPCKYDLRRFNAIGTISFDHPDPSIFTVLTSPGETPGGANCDFVIFPPRWMVAEDTFRPPWFHRNVMSEFMGLIHGAYDAKDGGFVPGGASLHNCMTSHGPDVQSWQAATTTALPPRKIEGTMAFMFESRHVFRPTRQAMSSKTLQSDYDACWQGFPKARLPPESNRS